MYRVYHKSWTGFTRSYLANPWDYKIDIGAKRCFSDLSFVWILENVDYLNFWPSYGRYTKKAFLLFLHCYNCHQESSFKIWELLTRINAKLILHNPTQSFNSQRHTQKEIMRVKERESGRDRKGVQHLCRAKSRKNN